MVNVELNHRVNSFSSRYSRTFYSPLNPIDPIIPGEGGFFKKRFKKNLIALELHMRRTWSFFYFKDKSIRHVFTYFQENIIITYLIMLNYVTQGVTFRLNRLQMKKLK